jgi:hypothetical protein
MTLEEGKKLVGEFQFTGVLALHELREGFRHNGVWVVPAHGPRGEFLPAFSMAAER